VGTLEDPDEGNVSITCDKTLRVGTERKIRHEFLSLKVMFDDV